MKETTINFETAFLIGHQLTLVEKLIDLGMEGSSISVVLHNTANLLKWNNFSRKTQMEISNVMERFKEELSADKKPGIGLQHYIRTQIGIWRDRLQNEFWSLKAIPIFTRGNLNIEKLHEGANTFFDSEIWEKMSDIARKDLEEAAMCLLVQSWTAAVMVALRAVEETIRRYYKEKCKKEAKDSLGPLLKELKNVKDVPKPLVNYFDYIRDVRNSADHPDRIFNAREAHMLFHQACGLIQIIYKEIS